MSSLSTTKSNCNVWSTRASLTIPSGDGGRDTRLRSDTKSSTGGVIDISSTDEDAINQAGLGLLYTLPEGRPVWGIASLDPYLYVVRAGACEVEVYLYTSLSRRFPIPGLINARDMAACELHRCLYITDVGGTVSRSAGYAVHRVETTDGQTTKWVLDDKPWGISVSSEATVLVTCTESAVVLEYTTDGRLLRLVRLPSEIVHPLHAHLLPVTNELVVSHGDGPDALHRVCVLMIDDVINETVVRTTSGLLHQSKSVDGGEHGLSLDVPGHMAVDGRGDIILVADINNNRILQTCRRRLHERFNVVLELDEGREYPVRLCLDSRGGRLYVAYNGAIRDGRWTVGRVFVFFCCFNACSFM